MKSSIIVNVSVHSLQTEVKSQKIERFKIMFQLSR